MANLIASFPWQRTITWGEALKTRIAHAEGGLARHIEPSRIMLGESVGVLNTWRKLTKAESPEELQGADLLRAWLLLVTLGETPEDWGVDTMKAVPAGFDQDRLRRELPRLVAGVGFEPTTSGLRARPGRRPHVVPDPIDLQTITRDDLAVAA